MLQLKEVKRNMIAGPAIQNFNFFIQWHLTERCNLRCRHCYQHRESTAEMTAAEVLHEIDGATEMFRAWASEEHIHVTPSIHFTGGEPLLHKGLWDILAHARSQGYRVALMTNGCLITGEDAERLRDLGVFDIQVSLEGPPSLHDDIRGRGSFAAASRGVKRLIRAGNTVSLNVTLSRLNAALIDESVGLARDLGVRAIGFSRLVPCGAGESLLDHLLTAGEVREAYERVHALDGPELQVISGDPLYGTISRDAPATGCGLTLSGCSAGFSGVTITSEGAVMACRRIGIRAGCLREKSLREIWADSSLLWRLRRRESYRGKCGACALWPSCRGCRAVAYAYTRATGLPDLFADDPQCWHLSS
jgi:radical SAM protein with 4Fe4S-binding SPASM domain